MQHRADDRHLRCRVVSEGSTIKSVAVRSACCATATSSCRKKAEDLVTRAYRDAAASRRRRGNVIRLEIEDTDAETGCKTVRRSASLSAP